MSSDTGRSIIQSAVSFSGGTFISRCSGLLRDISMAFFFGATPEVAAFMVAFRLANLLRRLFAETPLSSSFIPLYEQTKTENLRCGELFFRDFAYHLSFVLMLIILVGEGGIWAFSRFSEASFGLITKLTAIMLPSLLFICMSGLNSAYLQCHRRYFLSGIAPAGFNVIWILAVFLFRNASPGSQVLGLSYCIIFAFFTQWALTAAKLWSYLRKNLALKDIFRVRVLPCDVKQSAGPFILGILSVGALQINSAMDAFFARAASLEGPAYLWYAIRIEQVPLAFFGIAMSSALLPPLARASKDLLRHQKLFLSAFRKSLLLIFPAQLVLLVMGFCIVQLFFQYGKFSQTALMETTYCLWGYSLGLVPAALVIITAPFFHSQKYFHIPTKAAFLAVLVNFFLNYLFVYGLHFGPASIALATSAASIVQMLYLLAKLKMRWGRSFWLFSGKLLLISAVAATLTLYAGKCLFDDPTWLLWTTRSPAHAPFESFFQRLNSAAIQGSLFIGTFVLLGKLLCLEEIAKLFSFFKYVIARLARKELFRVYTKGKK
ncbi:MAG: murein biosynthesis integral membrane protein MurJ [Simkaniaceae bacterium]